MIDAIPLLDRPYAVLGLGRSGLAAARALLAAGAAVWAWDDEAVRRREAEAVGLALTDLTDRPLDGIAALVLSPGIPHTHPEPHPVASRARWAGVPVLGDIELLARACPGTRTLGITGTNGKSTTTALVAHIFGQAGLAHAAGGNLGPPALAFPRLGADGWYVLEMSSYQLELTFSLAFDVAVLLNITPDHLDRHGGLDGYIYAKSLIFKTDPKKRQTAVIGIDTDHSQRLYASLVTTGAWHAVPVSAERELDAGVYVVGEQMIDTMPGGAGAVLDLRRVPALAGRHNAENAAAAYAACRLAGLDTATVVRAIASFPGLAHRQQPVLDWRGVRFINDSKATNAQATARALACYDAIHWIVGGQAKAGGLDGLEAYLPRVRHAYLIGESMDAFATWCRGRVAYTCCGDLNTAVRTAAGHAGADPGAVVLLSPACASFDQFRDFEARGEVFAAAVRALAQEGSP